MQRRASVTGTLTPDERRELDKKVKAQTEGAREGGGGGAGGGGGGGGGSGSGGGGQVGLAAGSRGTSRSRARRNSLATLDMGGGADSPVGVTTFNRAGRRNSVAGSLAIPKSAFN